MDSYYMGCVKPSVGGTSHVCPYCHIIECGKVSRMKIDAKRPELDMFMELMFDSDNLFVEEPRGCGFVQFVDPADAADAKYQMDGQVFRWRELTVVFAEENRKKPNDMRMRELR
ncbi:putative RNA recognition motif domain, nucleotide-binding alpha-beta plait domain superfamily [Helianthus debilis subsp. tardiflorus]